MSNIRKDFEIYAKQHPDVKANPEVLNFVDDKYTNTVMEMHWQTYQQGRKDEAAKAGDHGQD